MYLSKPPKRTRSLRPTLAPLEHRELLSVTMPHHVEKPQVAAHVLDVQHHGVQEARKHSPAITVLNKAKHGGFAFVNVNGPNAGTNGGAGTNFNGISNKGTSVGFDIENNGDFSNFVANPLKSRNASVLNLGSTTANAFGVNSSGVVVGTDGNGNAFFLQKASSNTFIPHGGTGGGGLRHQRSRHNRRSIRHLGRHNPGFVRLNGNSFITINAPSGPTRSTFKASTTKA